MIGKSHERLDDLRQALGVVRVFGTMAGGQHEALVLQAQLIKYPTLLPGALPVVQRHIKHDIAARVIFGSLDELSTYLITAKRKRFDVHEVATMVGNSFLNGLVKKD